MTVDATRIGPPEKLSAEHNLSMFDSGEPVLDDWLRRRALNNEVSGASRTYVVCVGRKVVGYYALSAGAIAHTHAPGRIKRNMPGPIIPVVVLGRLAVDNAAQGKGVGTGLLRDAYCVPSRLPKLPASVQFWSMRFLKPQSGSMKNTGSSHRRSIR